jgi:hypothetical protein
MKKIVFALLVSAALYLAACKPESLKTYEPNSAFSLTNLQGTWKLTKVTQKDEDAIRKGFPYKELDVTTALNQNLVTLTFNLNGAAPGGYVINYGTAAKLLKVGNGNWILDDINKPGRINLASGTDTAKLILGSYANLLNNKLILVQKKFFNGKEAITYNYEFSKN